ncbi:type II toxin-antitoxin system HigB family toxin [Nostoc sp.]|uniref:type II toxin-antitoxin system HigB family toxin n=1 Tax=Nostoc sp. TaxID=1180 RepID=UPI003FA5835E
MPNSNQPGSLTSPVVQSELRSVFPSADLVGDLIVFNIGGNKYRLITSIHFNRQKVYIRDILTHSEYDKDQWKT